MKKRIICTLIVLCCIPVAVQAADDGLFEPDIPEVLTPVRLQQPQVEVPASVTVISAEQIRLWGVQDIASVFRFVPGMFVAQELSSNSSTVLYHSGDVVLARRLEVLVDGRSVYKASFANVDWDQLNIPVEDIARIEVTRGPSAASYGMNAFQGVIHIITRHPADSRDGVVDVDYGVGQRRHGYASFAFREDHVQQRVSLFGWKEGDGGYHADGGAIGGLPDLRQVSGLNWSGAWQADSDNSLRWQLGRQRLLQDSIADSNIQMTSPLDDSVSDIAWLRWQHQSSADHEWQVQAYWQGDNTRSEYRGCMPSIGLDPKMASLYQSNPTLADALALSVVGLQNGSLSSAQQTQVQQLYAGLASGAIDATQLSLLISQISGDPAEPISASDYLLARQVAAGVVGASALDESVCGRGNLDIYEQRVDVELQDTRRWSEQLRSVQGIGYRRDGVDSESYLGGAIDSSQWLAFMTLEYRPLDDLISSFGLMAEYRPDEKVRYSPRLGINYLLSDQQSFRFQIARSRRTPDLAERYLDATVSLVGLDDNYLGLENGTLFYRARASDFEHQLADEEIVATELGYFHYFSNPSLQLDIKLFQERLIQLISSHLALRNTRIDNHGNMRLRGLEGQLSWQPVLGQSLLLGWLAQDRQADDQTELNLGAENSLRLVWTRQSGGQEQMLGALWDVSRSRIQGNIAAGPYRQQTLLGRWGFDTRYGSCYLSTEYNHLAGKVLYERTPRWLSRIGWRYSW